MAYVVVVFFANCLYNCLQVDAYNTERALRKIKRQPSTLGVFVDEPSKKEVKVSREENKLKSEPEECSVSHNDDMESELPLSEEAGATRRQGNLKSFVGGPSSW